MSFHKQIKQAIERGTAAHHAAKQRAKSADARARRQSELEFKREVSRAKKWAKENLPDLIECAVRAGQPYVMLHGVNNKISARAQAHAISKMHGLEVFQATVESRPADDCPLEHTTVYWCRWEPVKSSWGFAGQVIYDQPVAHGHKYFG